MQFFAVSTIVLLLAPPTFAQVTPITEFPDYVTARVCVQNAVTSGIYYGVADYYLGCGQQQSQTCLCGTLGSVSGKINQYIYTHASSACGDTIEASSATGIFQEYCAAASDGTTDSTTTTAGSESQATTTGANPKSKATDPAATSTSTGSNTGNNNGGDSTNNINIKAGGASQTASNPTPIIVGVTVGLAVLSVLGISWRRNRDQESSANGRASRGAGIVNIQSDLRSNTWMGRHNKQISKWEDIPSEVELPNNLIHELPDR